MSAHPRAPLPHDAPHMEAWLPHAVVATSCVVIAPALVVWELVPQSSGWMLLGSVPLAMVLSVAVASLASALWKRRPGSRDLVFAELMLWGWLRRYRAERRIGEAHDLLGKDLTALTPEDRIEALVRLSGRLEARDAYTHGHSHRVTRHAEQIAIAMGLCAAEVAKVRTAAALHDVGKIDTPREILNKPGRLTDAEFAVVKRHPVDGAAMVASIGDEDVTAMIRHHHERLDGRGYPNGLTGESIPLGARIIAVADTFDAITSSRSYRAVRSHKQALDILRKESGTQLDARAVSAFLGYYSARQSVLWSALVASAPQRFLTWLGGATQSVGNSGATVAAAGLLTGLGSAAGPPASPPQTTERLDARPSPPLVAAATSPRRGEHRADADARSEQPRGRRSPAAPERRKPASTRPAAPRADTPGAQPTPVGEPQLPRPSSGPGPSRPNPVPSLEPGRDPPPTASAPPVDVPLVQQPPVHVPSVQVPTVRLPDVELPVDLPEVKIPGIEVGPIELPRVSLP